MVKTRGGLDFFWQYSWDICLNTHFFTQFFSSVFFFNCRINFNSHLQNIFQLDHLSRSILNVVQQDILATSTDNKTSTILPSVALKVTGYALLLRLKYMNTVRPCLLEFFGTSDYIGLSGNRGRVFIWLIYKRDGILKLPVMLRMIINIWLTLGKLIRPFKTPNTDWHHVPMAYDVGL